MKNRTMWIGIYGTAMLLAYGHAALADDRPGPPPQHHGPPPEAFTACESKAAGDACTVTFGSESIAGHCAAPPSGASESTLACRPDNMPNHGPPR